MTDYIFKDEATNTQIIASYTKGGKLKRVSTIKGVLELDGLEYFIPSKEKDIDTRVLKPHTPVKDDFFTKAQKAWYEFYHKRTGLEYRFTAADGGALKQIGKHLTAISGGSFEALEAWKFILQHWDCLDPFYRDNADLKFINSQLNKILNLLKNGKQTGQASNGNAADDLRRKFA